MFTRKAIFTGAAFVFLLASARAQGHAFPYVQPLKDRTLVPGGTATHGSSQPGPSSEFPNLDLGGFMGIDTGAGFTEWFDAGTKGSGASNLMSGFTFAYCSSQLAVESGGVGGTATLTFYEGYDGDWPDLVDPDGANGPLLAPQVEVAVFSLSGLPANTASASPIGGSGNYRRTTCYEMDVLLTTLIPFKDGPIGYSWRFRDLDSSGLHAATVPFLSCVGDPSIPGDCSGTDPDLVMTNGIDQYVMFPAPNPNDPPTHVIDFGGPPYFTSMSMDIFEVTSTTATTVSYNSTSPPNIDRLHFKGGSKDDPLSLEIPPPPLVIGGRWEAEVTHVEFPTATASTLLVRGAMAPGNGLFAYSYGRLLVRGPFIANVAARPSDTFPPIHLYQKNFDVTIPLQLGLAGQTWFGQAITVGGHPRLSQGVIFGTGTNQ